MFKIYNFFFINFLILGTLITISAYSWFSMWIGLEINLLSFIPLMKSQSNNLFPAEATLKYFITQSLASMILLFSVLLILNTTEFMIYFNYWLMLVMNSALMTKLGAAPFHAWFPEVAEGLNWLNNFLLMTWQKIGPMILIMYNLNSLFFSIIIIISSLTSGLLGLNQMSLRKLLAYSSINHIAWMLASMLNWKMIWMIYFLIYSMITFSIIFMLNYLKIFFLNQLMSTLNLNKLLKLFFIFNFLSLGGLPPFLGFLPKWLVIMNLVENNYYFLSLTLIISTLITLFFYLRITFSSLTLMLNEFYQPAKMNQNFLILLNSMILLSLIICTMIFSNL